MGQRLAASRGPTAESTLISLCHLASTALSFADQLARHPVGRDGMGRMDWAGLLAWAAAALSAAFVLVPLAEPDNREELSEAACAIPTIYLTASSRLGADADTKAQAHLPAILHVLLHAADQLPMPGERPWLCTARAEWLPIASAMVRAYALAFLR